MPDVSSACGPDPRALTMPSRVLNLGQPALFIPSADDRVVSIEDSLAAAAAWPGARHWRVDGLGHRRIVTDPMVVTTAIDFVTAPH